MYLALNDESFMGTSRAHALANLWTHVRLKHFVRCLRHDGQIVAWILAVPMQHEHADYVVLQQLYYASNQTGLRAAKCVLLLHDALYAHALTTDCKYVLSMGSPYDEANVFSRLLERAGWTRRGYAARREVPEKAPGCPQVGRVAGGHGYPHAWAPARLSANPSFCNNLESTIL